MKALTADDRVAYLRPRHFGNRVVYKERSYFILVFLTLYFAVLSIVTTADCWRPECLVYRIENKSVLLVVWFPLSRDAL